MDDLLGSYEAQDFWPVGLALSSCCHFKSQLHNYINPAFLDEISVRSPADWKLITERTGWLQPDAVPWRQVIGSFLEAILDFGRMLWLSRRGYAPVERVAFVPRHVTPRNHLIRASRTAALLLESPQFEASSRRVALSHFA